MQWKYKIKVSQPLQLWSVQIIGVTHLLESLVICCFQLHFNPCECAEFEACVINDKFANQICKCLKTMLLWQNLCGRVCVLWFCAWHKLHEPNLSFMQSTLDLQSSILQMVTYRNCFMEKDILTHRCTDALHWRWVRGQCWVTLYVIWIKNVWNFSWLLQPWDWSPSLAVGQRGKPHTRPPAALHRLPGFVCSHKQAWSPWLLTRPDAPCAWWALFLFSCVLWSYQELV
jgi:hypothetical protein